MRFTLNVQRRLIHLEGCSRSVLLKSAIEILMQLQKDWMHRWNILLFLSFFSPIFSTSLFLFSSLLHLAQPLFFSNFLIFSAVSSYCLFSTVTSSYSLLFVFYIILFSCYCLLFSSLLSPLLIVSSPLILHFLFFSTPLFLFSSLLPTSHSIVCNILNFSSPLFLFPLVSSHLTLIFCSSSILLVSSFPLSSFSHLLSSPLILIWFLLA